jgi:hypothetical protein
MFLGQKAFRNDFEVAQFREPLECCDKDGQLSAALVTRIQAMLRRNPQNRPSASEVSNDWIWQSSTTSHEVSESDDGDDSGDDDKHPFPVEEWLLRNLRTLGVNDCARGEIHTATMDLIAKIIQFAAKIGYEIASRPMLYTLKEGQGLFKFIAEHLNNWEDVAGHLENWMLRNQVRNSELILLANTSEQLYDLMRYFVTIKGIGGQSWIVIRYNANELIQRLEHYKQAISKELSDGERGMCSMFWNLLRENIGTQVQQQSNNDLQWSIQIVFWGIQLERLGAAVFFASDE